MANWDRMGLVVVGEADGVYLAIRSFAHLHTNTPLYTYISHKQTHNAILTCRLHLQKWNHTRWCSSRPKPTIVINCKI